VSELLVSTRKGLFHLVRGERGWITKSPFFVGDNVSLALATGNTWYAALNLGHFGVKLKSSTDAVKTWNELAVPAYPEGAVIATADGKPPTPATLKQFWALESHNGRLWAGTAPGGLFHSDDCGQTWNLNKSLWNAPERMHWFGGGTDTPAIHSLCFHGNTILLAVSCGGVWRSRDNGGTWENIGEGLFASFMPPEMQFQKSIQDAHMMVQCRDQPEHVWIQHHNGVFRSTDGGETFMHLANAPSNGFGFAVAVHPEDGKTAWFVPATKDECRVPMEGRFEVVRTRDGGATFEGITNGLPSGPAYDIVFRHALAIDSTGQVLAMGSTTGGLWISENGGNNWKEIELRLPPIHAVRFI
jgi:photosystem II stability/assembly factor-like uncharacterized protein